MDKSEKWFVNTLLPNGTLKNKLGITNAQKLSIAEHLESSAKSIELLNYKPKIKSIDQLKSIHKHMFGRIYSWAGEPRRCRLQKGSTEFLPPQCFRQASLQIDSDINKINHTKKPSKMQYAKLYDEINYFHPFREGNGRGERVFMSSLAANHGQVLDYPRNNKEMIQAEEVSNIPKIASLLNLQDAGTPDLAFQKLVTKYQEPDNGLDL